MTTPSNTTTPPRAIATDRPEDEPCQAGTPGCCIDHTVEANLNRGDLPCETW